MSKPTSPVVKKPKQPQVHEIPIDRIMAPHDMQMRERMLPDRVDELASLVENGVQFKDEMIVFSDGGAYYWLADGHHRFQALKRHEKTVAMCAVYEGGQREAMLFACGANEDHGIKRTNGDKRKAVMALLKDEEWGKWSSRQIADVVKVSDTFVNKIRKENFSGANVCTRIGADGVEQPATKPARRPKPEPAPDHHNDELKNQKPQADHNGSQVLDDKGTPCPNEAIAQAFRLGRGYPADVRSRLLVEMKRVDAVKGHKFMSRIFINQVIDGIKSIRRAIRMGVPHVICPACEGTLKYEGEDCGHCNGNGWLSRTDLKEVNRYLEDKDNVDALTKRVREMSAEADAAGEGDEE